MTVFWHKRFYFPIAKNKIFSLQLRSYCKKEATFLFSSQKSWRCFFTCAMVHWILKKWSYPSSKKIFLYNDQKSFFSYFLNDNIFMHELERLPLHESLFKSNAKFENKGLKNDYLFRNIKDAKMILNTIDILYP